MRRWLKEIRIEKKMTQEKLAKKAGIERSYYTMIEQGKRNPSVAVAKQIAIALGIQWTIFFEDSCNETTQKMEVM